MRAAQLKVAISCLMIVLERYIKILEGDLSELGREAIKIGSEIGMHGYNHNPLSLYGGMNYGEEYKDYKPWENIKVMEKANKMFLGVVKKLFGEKFKIFSNCLKFSAKNFRDFNPYQIYNQILYSATPKSTD